VLQTTDSIALDRLLVTQLALQAYKGEHGAYPAYLSDLVPRYLSRVPDDPFSDGQPLRYRRTGGKYLLYSIGPDAKDDGGRPIFETITNPPSYNIWMDPNETGDIVAGTNY
jgi:hypothetical protein